MKAEVKNGHVTLTGEVEYPFQRRDAEHAVRNLIGVKRVLNEVKIKSRVNPSAVEQQIKNAFVRNARFDARQITVTASDGTAHLSGHVHSLAEKRTAEAAANCAPGVISVDDHLAVVP